MEPTVNPSRDGAEDPATQGAVPVNSVLALSVNEAAPAKSDAEKEPDDKSSKALEWAKAVGMPLVTLVVTLVGGYYFTDLAKEREVRETSLVKEREDGPRQPDNSRSAC